MKKGLSQHFKKETSLFLLAPHSKADDCQYPTANISTTRTRTNVSEGHNNPLFTTGNDRLIFLPCVSQTLLHKKTLYSNPYSDADEQQRKTIARSEQNRAISSTLCTRANTSEQGVSSPSLGTNEQRVKASSRFSSSLGFLCCRIIQFAGSAWFLVNQVTHFVHCSTSVLKRRDYALCRSRCLKRGKPGFILFQGENDMLFCFATC